RFYISLEDDLMRLFGSDKTSKIVASMGIEEDEPIEHSILAKAIESAQKKVEGNNFSTRKHLLEYDQVMNEQREIIYRERKRVLYGENLRSSIISMIHAIVRRTADRYLGDVENGGEWNLNEFYEQLLNIIPVPVSEFPKDPVGLGKEGFIEKLSEISEKLYEAKEAEIGIEENMRELERVVMLKVIDQKWMDHIDDMDQMRQGIGLHAIAQRDPLMEYKFAGYEMFDELSENIQDYTVRTLYRVRLVTQQIERKEEERPMFTNKDDSLQKKPEVRKDAKVGRNDPCPCGSGKKYKQCCGR
ncbi:MAG: SEC-C domain-containing protein, partial [Firmicutes bacterium]|nr:SEC-C domain-containing protein [Bacillota bacterium]